MISRHYQIRGRTVREWSCHGWTWELMLSRLYPERAQFVPRCPTCIGERPVWEIRETRQ